MPRTNFRPEADGFAFENNWTFDEAEKNILRQHITDALPAVEAVLSPIIIATGAPIFAAEMAVPFIGPYLVALTVEAINEQLINNIVAAISADTYGLCGGMAFTSLDYWKKQWVIARGNNVNDQPARESSPGVAYPAGAALRDYIWNRLLDSVRDNAETFLTWMAVYHFDFVSGGNWLKNQTLSELAKLKTSINSGTPVTIGLVGTTWNPMDNHQVLVYGYEDNADGTCTLFIYDNCIPDTETTTILNFSGSSLTAIESNSSNERGPLQGFFCTKYSPSVPPFTLVLDAGITVAPPLGVVGYEVNVKYTVKNIGYHTSPSLSLRAFGDMGNSSPETQGKQIKEDNPLEDNSLEFNAGLIFQKSGNHTIYAMASLDNSVNINILKVFPPEGSSQLPMVKVSIYDQRTIDVLSSGFNCINRYDVVNRTVVFSTEVKDLPQGVSFSWVAKGGVITGSNTEQTVSIKMPGNTNTPCNVRVFVKISDDIYTIGTIPWFTCISEEVAEVLEATCISHINRSIPRLVAQFGHMKNLGDPGPGDKIYFAPEELLSISNAAQQVVESLKVLIDENRGLTIGSNLPEENITENLPGSIIR